MIRLRPIRSGGGRGEGARGAGARCVFAALLTAAGCPPAGAPPVVEQPRPGGPPRETREIVAAIERNAARLDQALWSDTVHVVAHLLDQEGREHVQNLDGSLLFVRPRRLRMDLRHGLGAPVMQIGSNDEDYWFWIEPELKGMWWGRHRHVGKPCVGHLAVRPDQLVAALGLGGLPRASDGLRGPIRVYGKTSDILTYWRSPSDPSEIRARQYRVSREPPYAIRLVAFLDRFGRKTMVATLDDYAPAWEGGPVVAHSIVVDWPQEGGRFSLSFDRLRAEPADRLRAGWFDRPSGERLPAAVRGNVVQVDAACEE